MRGARDAGNGSLPPTTLLPARNDDVTGLLFAAFYCFGGRYVTPHITTVRQDVPPATGACLAVQRPVEIGQ